MQPGELRKIARTLSTVENRSGNYETILAEAYRQQRWADVIGITGPPGAGKSTLVDALTAHWAQSGMRVAVLAVDPSSPYSGGAVLGDRIRRTRSGGFDNTYFRSLSARGHVGGLSETATDLVAVLSLFGFARVIIETVGAGQSDIEIQSTADCTVVVSVPGLGDGVQASKAGMMEIGDIFAVNKADLPGADLAARTIEAALGAAYMGHPGVNAVTSRVKTAPASYAVTPGIAALMRRHGDMTRDESVWVPPVIPVAAAENRAIDRLAETVEIFLGWSDRTGRRTQRGRERAYGQMMRALSALLLAPYAREPGAEQWPASVEPWIERIAKGGASPLEAARALLSGTGRGEAPRMGASQREEPP